MKRLPLLSFAILVLSLNRRKTSSSLVMITFTFIFLEIFFSSLFATSNAISFSLVPLYPTAPGSLPPCPASIITVLNSHFSFSLLRSTVLIVFWSSKFEVNLISSLLYLNDEGSDKFCKIPKNDSIGM